MSGKFPEMPSRRVYWLGWLCRLAMLGGVAAMFWALLQCFVLLHGEPPLQRAPLRTPWTLLALGLALFLAGFCGEYRLWRRRAGC